MEALAFAIFGIGIGVKSIFLLFLSRIMAGFVGGNVSVAQAAMADITPAKKRAARFGMIGAAYGIGFILGPVFGGLLSGQNIFPGGSASTPFWFSAGLCLLNAILVRTLMEETMKKPREGFQMSWYKALKNVAKAYYMKRLRGVFATNFFFQSGITFFATFFSVFLIENFHFSQSYVGYYIGYAGILIVVAQGVILPMLNKRFETDTILKIFLIIGSAATFLYYIPAGIFGLAVVGAIFALTNGVSMAALPSIVSLHARENEQGEILGINASVQSLAQIAPPIISGFLAAEIAPAAPIYIAGVTLGVAWLVFMFAVKANNS
jgi:DHA1 family tetracycline resistance protein-like MFS transporter